MAYTNLFDGCTHSIGGIKDFKIATKKTNGDPITFPLDAYYLTGSTDTVVITEDFDARKIVIGTDEIEFRYVYPKSCEYEEEEVEERQGRYYRKTLVFEMPKINPTTQNQLKDFLFNTNGEFATGAAIVFFTDTNNQQWFGSITQPFVLENYDSMNGTRGGENKYVLRYVCNDYYRTTKYTTQ